VKTNSRKLSDIFSVKTGALTSSVKPSPVKGNWTTTIYSRPITLLMTYSMIMAMSLRKCHVFKTVFCMQISIV